MARIPSTMGNRDYNNWGDILNDWLSKMPFFNVQTSYGAAGDGIADDSTPIANARAAANANGGGIVYYPPGTYISGNQIFYKNVFDIGAGRGVTTIKLKNGANTDLFSGQTGSINLSASFGAGSAGTLYNFGMMSMTLDGNKAGQSSGPSWCMRFYGYDFIFRDLEIKNGYSGGVLCDWNGGGMIAQPSNEMEAIIDNVKIHDCNGIGLQMGGPHDSRLNNILIFNTGSHAFHLAPNAVGTLLSQCHPYHMAQSVTAVGYLIEANGCQFINCMCEGSDAVQVALIASACSIMGGQIFGNTGYAGVGLQLGQPSGQTPIPGQINQSGGTTTAIVAQNCSIHTKFIDCTNGAINFWNENINVLFAKIHQASGTVLVSSRYPDASDMIAFNTTGITSDHTLQTSSGFWLGGSSYNLLRLFDLSYTDIFNVDVVNKNIGIPNSAGITGYSDNYSTQTFQLQAWSGNILASGYLKPGNSSAIYSGSGVPSSSLGSNGDYYFRTDTPAVALQRIYVKSAGAWVGIL